MTRFDVAVVGAGSFGAWCASHLSRAGRRVLLVDAYGPGNSRSSSGGETRIIRMGYGADEVYTRSSMRSLELWRALIRESGQPLFSGTGVLWLAPAGHRLTRDTQVVLERLGVPHEVLGPESLRQRYPQIACEEDTWGLLELGGGVLMARRAVQAVVDDAVRRGCAFRRAVVRLVAGEVAGRLDRIPIEPGGAVAADTFVFACGPWLPKVFPDVLGGRIFPTRQEVFFFGIPAGDPRFAPETLPAWIDFGRDQVYGLPDLDGRGLKVARDRHGPPFDPDTGDRRVSTESEGDIRRVLAARFPALVGAPLLETRVCQYENTSNGDFLVDRHPSLENVWLVGGGSGHGFKHGPAVGEYLARQVLEGGPAEPRFALEAKGNEQSRTVF
jgi:sarcosine oxidase